MYTLYHYPLCPLSRQIRIILEEKSIEFDMVIENYWHKSNAFPEISPASGVPILTNDKIVLSDATAIYEYLEENHLERNLLGYDIDTRANCRRIAMCFNSSFFHLITKPIIMQRIVSFSSQGVAPDSNVIRQARDDVRYFLDYISYLLKKNKWLVSQEITIADFVVSSHLSVLDYFGDVPWDFNVQAKEWYSVIKSRPSFKNILKDRIAGFFPSKNYENLDF